MFFAPLVLVFVKNSKRKMGGPPVYKGGLFDLTIDPS
jgi:hypothetical protein